MMKQILKLTKVELRRLLMNKKTYILICINVLLIALGYNDYIKELLAEKLFCYFTSANMNYVIFPFCLGCLEGSLIWGISLILDADRFRKNGTLDMVKAYTREEDISIARILAYNIVVCVTFILSALIYLPVCIGKLQYLFDIKTYLVYTLVSMLPGMIITLFLCESIYILTRNVSVSVFMFLLLTAVQFTTFVQLNTFFRWNAPQWMEVSDAYGSAGVVRFQIYTRILLMLTGIGFWGVSLLFVRRFQFGALKSFVIGSRKPVRFVPAVIFLGMAAVMIVKQPFIDHSPVVDFEEEFNFVDYDDQGEFSKKETNVYFNTLMGTLKGEMDIDIIEALNEEFSFYLNSGIKIKSLTLDGEKLEYESDYDWEDKTNINFARRKYVIKNPGNKTGKLKIEYVGYPMMSNSLFTTSGYTFIDSIGRNSIYLASSTIGPEFNGLMGSDETLYINVPKDHTPTSMGYPLEKVGENEDGTVKWKLNGYITEIQSGNYMIDNIDYEAKHTTFSYGARYSSLVKENDMDGAVSDVMHFCDKHFGELKHTEDIDDIRIHQRSNDIPGGGAIFGNIEMDEDFLSPSVINDENAGANMNETFMHEIVHLFWGDLGCSFENEGVWSAEGLTVYTTYRIVKEKYGELYAKQYYVDKWKEGVKYQNNNFYMRHPEYLDKLPEAYQVNILNSVDIINKYDRMPLMLLKAEELLGGEEAMDEVLRELYERGDGFGIAEEGVTFQDFLDIAGLTEEDLKID